MAYSLVNQTVPDPGEPALQLLCPGADKIDLRISDAAVLVAFGVGVPLPIYGPDEFFPPVNTSQPRRADAVRVIGATASQPAQISITATVPGEA